MEFTSLKEQAEFFLNTYWENWNSTQSYILPPIFKFKRANICDADLKSVQVIKGEYPLDEIKDRSADEAEHLIYNCFQQFARETLLAPFIAIRGLDINKQHKLLERIFPDQALKDFLIEAKSNNELCEHDFVIVGPKIGLVFIEVKSCKFEGSSDFKNTTHLPKKYNDGLQQLEIAKKILTPLIQVSHNCCKFSKKIPLEYAVKVRLVLWYWYQCRRTRLDHCRGPNA